MSAWRCALTLVVWVQTRADRTARSGRCDRSARGYDRGGGARRWRHVDTGFIRCMLEGRALRVACQACRPTGAAVPWARHDTVFTRAFEDVVAHDAVRSNKTSAVRRYEITWRTVDTMCDRLLAEAMHRVDLLDGLAAVAIDEAKARKGQRYLTMVSEPLHRQGRVGHRRSLQGDRHGALRCPGQRTSRSPGDRDHRSNLLDPHRRRRPGPEGGDLPMTPST